MIRLVALALALACSDVRAASPGLDLPVDELRRLEVEWRLESRSACHRPAAHEYLRLAGRLTGPSIDQLCPSLPVVSARGETIELEFGRLFEVQYLIAGRGGGVASRFGHAMLRLVFCAPERSKVDERCRADEFEAIDLGFAAHTDTQTFSVLGGVTGRYPSWLVITPDSDLRHRYVDEELRDLIAAPLKLDADGRRLLLALLAERHWTYDGRYKFLSNNCADEVLHLIQASLPAAHPLVAGRPDVITPGGLLEELEDAGLVAPDRFRWASRRETLDAGLKELGLGPRTVKAYLRVPAARRAAWAREHAPKKLTLFTALEDAALRDDRATLVRAAVDALYKSDVTPTCGRTREDLRRAMEGASAALSPTRLKHAGPREIPRAADVIDPEIIARRHRDVASTVDAVIGCFRAVPAVERAWTEFTASQAIARQLQSLLFKK